MGKLIDLDERRQIQALHRALLDSMARLVRLSRRYGEALVELAEADQERAPAPDEAASDPPAPDRSRSDH